MQFYFITHTVDILYGTIRVRGLADYGTEGETINVAPEQYAGAESPLRVEVIAGSDGRIDIEIPPRSE